MEEADSSTDDVEASSVSSGEDDIPNVKFLLPDESSFIPKEVHGEFPGHEADDALVDELQEELEREVNLPNLSFEFEKWDEEENSLDDPPIMSSPVHTTFHPDFDTTKDFASTKRSCFEYITGLDLSFFLHITRIMNDFVERKKDEYGRLASSKWIRFEVYEIYRCIGIILKEEV